MTDKSLIEKYISGQTEILPILVKRWHNKFCQKAYWVVKDPSLAKDIAQDSWITIIDKLYTLKDPAKFEFWALRIVYTKSINEIQKINLERLKQQDLKIQNSFDTNLETDHTEQKQKLLKAIKQLSIEKQSIVHLFYVEQYTIREISGILSISIGTVKSRLFKAREELKKTIKK